MNLPPAAKRQIRPFRAAIRQPTGIQAAVFRAYNALRCPSAGAEIYAYRLRTRGLASRGLSCSDAEWARIARFDAASGAFSSYPMPHRGPLRDDRCRITAPSVGGDAARSTLA